MADKISVLFSEEEVNARIKEMGEQISKDYAGNQYILFVFLRARLSLHANLQKG